jgi:hypothetical protein
MKNLQRKELSIIRQVYIISQIKIKLNDHQLLRKR